MVVRFSFERGKSCRYSTYTYYKQLNRRILEGGRGGGGHAPLNPPLPEGTPVPQHWMTLYLQRVWVFKAALFISDFIIIIIIIIIIINFYTLGRYIPEGV